MSVNNVSVLLVEDQEFLASMISEGLIKLGYEVSNVFSIAEAITSIEAEEPNIVITDLNFGLGPSGLDLITYLDEKYPWIAKMILSAHQSVELATGKSWMNPNNVPYVVKSEINSLAQIQEHLQRSLVQGGHMPDTPQTQDKLQITKSQAEILRMVSEGLSNSAIASLRKTSVRAVETLLARTYEALGIADDPDINPRVVATNLLANGEVYVK